MDGGCPDHPPVMMVRRGQPAVSVIMPTFEQSSFLTGAIGSLLRQTFTDWELLVIDNGSLDGTSAAVKPFLWDSRISYQRFPDNRGLGQRSTPTSIRRLRRWSPTCHPTTATIPIILRRWSPGWTTTLQWHGQVCATTRMRSRWRCR
jgi:glycosyl transferase family 2